MLKRKQLAVMVLCGGLMAGLAQAQVPSMPGPSGTLLSSVAATTTSTPFSVSGYGITTFQVSAPAVATGTLTYQGSLDNVNWTTMTCWQTGTTTAATSTSATGNTIPSALTTCNTDGIPSVRVVLSPWLGGTWTTTVGTSYMPRTK